MCGRPEFLPTGDAEGGDIEGVHGLRLVLVDRGRTDLEVDTTLVGPCGAPMEVEQVFYPGLGVVRHRALVHASNERVVDVAVDSCGEDANRGEPVEALLGGALDDAEVRTP